MIAATRTDSLKWAKQITSFREEEELDKSDTEKMTEKKLDINCHKYPLIPIKFLFRCCK